MLFLKVNHHSDDTYTFQWCLLDGFHTGMDHVKLWQCVSVESVLTLWTPVSFMAEVCGRCGGVHTVPPSGANVALPHTRQVRQVRPRTRRAWVRGSGRGAPLTEMPLGAGDWGFLKPSRTHEAGNPFWARFTLVHAGQVVEVGKSSCGAGVLGLVRSVVPTRAVVPGCTGVVGSGQAMVSAGHSRDTRRTARHVLSTYHGVVGTGYTGCWGMGTAGAPMSGRAGLAVLLTHSTLFFSV